MVFHYLEGALEKKSRLHRHQVPHENKQHIRLHTGALCKGWQVTNEAEREMEISEKTITKDEMNNMYTHLRKWEMSSVEYMKKHSKDQPTDVLLPLPAYFCQHC